MLVVSALLCVNVHARVYDMQHLYPMYRELGSDISLYVQCHGARTRALLACRHLHFYVIEPKLD